jgi:hypothetical protein
MRTVFLTMVGALSMAIAFPLSVAAGSSIQVSTQARVYATLGEISYGCVTIEAVASGVVTGKLDVVVATSARDLLEGHGHDYASIFRAALMAGNSSRGTFRINPGVQHVTISYGPAVLRYGYRQIPPFTTVDSTTIYYRVPFRSCARWGRSL